jgi:RNA polymerase sigma factor (sigma-70 family)
MTTDASAAIPDSSTNITREYTAREQLGALAKVLGTLGPTDRLLIELRYQRDLTAKEIALTMGLPSQAHVYRRLETVFARLRSELELAGIESPQAA